MVYHPSGSLAQSLTTDRVGRQNSILMWTVVFTIGVMIQTATTYSIVQITMGRFITGLGVGALSGLSPLRHYISCSSFIQSHRACLQRRDGTEIYSWSDARAISASDHHRPFFELRRRSRNPYHSQLGVLAYSGRLAVGVGAHSALGYLLFAGITVSGFCFSLPCIAPSYTHVW